MKAIPAIWICLSQSISKNYHVILFHEDYNDVAVVVEVSNDSLAKTCPSKFLEESNCYIWTELDLIPSFEAEI